jgi:hypothetical protein
VFASAHEIPWSIQEILNRKLIYSAHDEEHKKWNKCKLDLGEFASCRFTNPLY